MPYQVIFTDELYHHGIKGQKWGVRRYRNRDGTLTTAGKRRYSDSVKSRTKNYVDTINSLSDNEFKLFTDGEDNKKQDIEFIKKYAKQQPKYKDSQAFVSRYGNVTMASLETNGLGDKEWNIGWATNPKYRGTGVTQKNIKKAIKEIRKYSNVPISAIIEPHNIASQRTAEKAGFKDAGYTRMNDGRINKRYVYN